MPSKKTVKTSDIRTERLMQLAALLLGTQVPMTARRIQREMIRQRKDFYSQRYSNFKRAFERDKADLRNIGLPISVRTLPDTDPPEQGYIIRSQDFFMPDLSPEEFVALSMARQIVSLEGSRGDSGLHKLLPKLLPDGEMALAPEPANIGVKLPKPPNLLESYRAIQNKQVLSFKYDKGDGPTLRKLSPVRLDYARGDWFITGFDHLRSAIRTFNLRKIVGTANVAETADFQNVSLDAESLKIRMPPWEVPVEEPVAVKLLVDAPLAGVASRRLAMEGDKLEDGSTTFDVKVGDRQEFFRFLGFFLDRAEILEPSELRQDFIAHLKAISNAKTYTN